MPSMRARAIVLLALLVSACHAAPADVRTEGSAATRLRPPRSPGPGPRVRQTVYVPVYSSIYVPVGHPHVTVELAATVSLRNVSPRDSLVVESVRYYDSQGKHVRDHVAQPGELAPLASVEFVVPMSDTTGGPGANFLIDWSGPAGIDAPLVEAIMTGQSGNAGISFTSLGRVLASPSP